MNQQGNFAFGGLQRSASFGCFHADTIPNSQAAVNLPLVYCEMAFLQNDPDSTGNVVCGSDRLSSVGNGFVLEPGQSTGWIPVQRLDCIWHKEMDATTTLHYMVVGCMVGGPPFPVLIFLLQDQGGHVLLEDGDKIKL